MADSTGSSIPWVKVIFVSLGIVALLAICVYIYRRNVHLAKTEPMLISDPTLMSNAPAISGNKAALSTTGSEYTYNMWINVNDWQKGYGNVKNVLTRANSNPFTTPRVISNPTIWFYPTRII